MDKETIEKIYLSKEIIEKLYLLQEDPNHIPDLELIPDVPVEVIDFFQSNCQEVIEEDNTYLKCFLLGTLSASICHVYSGIAGSTIIFILMGENFCTNLYDIICLMDDYSKMKSIKEFSIN